MKKTKIFTLGGILLLSLGALSGCIETDEPGDDDSNIPSSGDDDTSKEDSNPFTVTLNGLQSFYTPTSEISFSDVSLTLTYSDLTSLTLTSVEYDVETRTNEDTEFILYTDGLYNAVSSGDTIEEKTYSLSYLIYLEEDVTDEEGKTSKEVVTYSGVPSNQQSVVVTSNPTQIYSVYEFNAPDLQVAYEKNVAESVSEEGGSENEDKFFVEPDYYEVGDDNPFIYQPTVYLFNRATLQFEFPTNFPMDFKVSRLDSETESDETLDLAENDYVSLSGYSFQFTEAAVGEVFTISASLSDFTTDMVGNPLPTHTFTVKVEDGWNVYDELDLGRMNLTSEGFDEGWDLWTVTNRATRMGEAKEQNYENHGRAFFANGTTNGYQTFANKYWVDNETGEPVSESVVKATEGYEELYHQEYSLTQDVDYDVSTGTTNDGAPDNRFEYRVRTDHYWRDFLESKGRTDLHEVNGIFLHTDLTITEDCIPDEFKLSSEEAYWLGPHSDEGLSNWGTEVAAALGPLLKVSEDGTDYQYDDMDGAIRDRANLYLHHMEDEFILNGNLFSIDTSELKWSMNNVFLSSMNFYYTEDTNFAVQGNSCLFVFDYNREATSPNHNNDTEGVYAGGVPLATVTNLRYKGNSMGITQSDINNTRTGRQITNAEFASGSLSFIKSEAAQVKVDNVICTDANIAYWSQHVHENDELYGIEVTNSKTYDCYTTAFYIWCGGNVMTSNSEYKRFGGPLSICISTYEGSNSIYSLSTYYLSDYSNVVYQTDENEESTGLIDTSSTTASWPSRLIMGENVVTESLCGGTEAWFVLNNATPTVQQVKSYDYLLNKAGKSIVVQDGEDAGKMNLKSLFMDTTYILSGQYALHGSYVSSISDNYWNSQGGYAIDRGANTEMQHYIDEYAKVYSVKVGEEKGGFLGLETIDVMADVATPLYFTNTGNVFGFAEGADLLSAADPVGDNSELIDLKAYESSGDQTKTPAKFSENDTEVFMVLPLQADLGDIDGNSITVDLYQIVVDVLAAEGIEMDYDTVKGAIAALVLLGDKTLSQWDDLTKVPLGDLLRLDYELDLSTLISGLKISIKVGMGDTLIGVVMDLYDYDSQA